MPLWQAALPYFQASDITYANLEGPIAPGMILPGGPGRIYTGFPLFNYPPDLATALKKSDVDIVSTANNHALDRGPIGINKTIETLTHATLLYTGTRLRHSDVPFLQKTVIHGIKLVWLACTEHTNGIADPYQQVLYCDKKNDRAWLLKKIKELRTQYDVIIVTPHWGEEHDFTPSISQVTFAHQLLEAGANIIIGSHPHVLQKLEKYITNDGRATLIMYSLGNFVSFQGNPRNRAMVILLIGLTKTAQRTIINGVRFVPMYMENRNGLDNLKLLPLNEKSHNSPAFSIVSRIMPMGNALYTPKIITNPACF